jgi:hypothetical protein
LFFSLSLKPFFGEKEWRSRKSKMKLRVLFGISSAGSQKKKKPWPGKQLFQRYFLQSEYHA